MTGLVEMSIMVIRNNSMEDHHTQHGDLVMDHIVEMNAIEDKGLESSL
jgi:hypothetical protein